MISDYLHLTINSFDKVLMPAIEAGCGRKDIAAAKVVRANLADILTHLVSWERNAGPNAAVRLAIRDFPPGTSWAFRDHRTMAEVIATERPTTGGDAA